MTTGLSWVPIDVNLRSHPKTLMLAATIGDPRAHTWLTDAWLWAYRNAPSGTFSGSEAGRILEMAVGWTGEAHQLWRAMLATRWLDQLEDGALRFHDWEDHAGPLLAKAERDAARQRKRRKTLAKKFGPKGGKRARTSRRTSRGRPRDVSGNLNPNPNPNPNPNLNIQPPPPPEPPPADPEPAAASGEAVEAGRYWLAIAEKRDELELPHERPPSGKALREFESFVSRASAFGLPAVIVAYEAYALDPGIKAAGHPTRVFIRDGVWDTRLPPRAGPRPAQRLCTFCDQPEQTHLGDDTGVCLAHWREWMHATFETVTTETFAERLERFKREHAKGAAA